MQEKPYFTARYAQGVTRENRKVASILIMGKTYDIRIVSIK